jgi:hypothetical protein
MDPSVTPLNSICPIINRTCRYFLLNITLTFRIGARQNSLAIVPNTIPDNENASEKSIVDQSK